MLRQLTKQQIIEKFRGQDEVSAHVRLTIQGKTPKRIRSEVMPLYLEWGQRSRAAHQPPEVFLRAIAPMDLNWPEGDEQAITEGGDIVVGNSLMQIFAEDGQGQPIDEPEKAGDKFVSRVGELYNPNRTVWPQAVEYNYRANTHELRLFLARLKNSDVREIRDGPAEFALVLFGDIIFFCSHFGAALPWSDSPYSIHMVKAMYPDEYTLPPEQLAHHEGAALNITLIACETGIVQAVRLVGLGHTFSLALHQAIRAQPSRPFNQADYDRQLVQAYALYPTTEALLEQAAITCLIPARAEKN